MRRAARVREHEELAPLATAWTARWDGRWQYQVRDGNFAPPRDDAAAASSEVAGLIAVFRVGPTRAFAISRGPYSHTTYRF